MKRIDMLGASGIGKSTLVMRCQSKNNICCMLPWQALSQAALAASVGGIRMSWRKRLLRTLPLVKHRGLNNVVRMGEQQAFFEYFNNYAELLAIAHKAFVLSERSEYRRAEGYYYFISTLRRLAFLEKWVGDATVLFDESLSQKVYAVMPCDQGSEVHAQSYFKHMPAPDALVYIHADTDLIVKRIRERQRKTGKLIPGHFGLDDDKLHEHTKSNQNISHLGAKVLRQRGVPVLSLDAGNQSCENASELKEFIRDVVQ